MHASKKAKIMGFKSLKELSESSGGVSRQTLNNWNNEAPIKFDIFLLGASMRRLFKVFKSLGE